MDQDNAAQRETMEAKEEATNEENQQPVRQEDTDMPLSFHVPIAALLSLTSEAPIALFKFPFFEIAHRCEFECECFFCLFVPCN